jgi:deoxyadenosine/deoxycytidine kinase
MLIVVGGMIGLGKTSVAELLGKKIGGTVFYESVDDNPILPLFYTMTEEELAAKRIPFLLQLFFLNKRFNSIKEAYLERNNIQDRSIFEDWYFAKVNKDLGRISSLEFTIYEDLLNSMMDEIEELPQKKPDLMVYLKGSFETVMRRINMRNRDFEQDAGLVEYYQRLWSGYDDWVYNSYNASEVLTIDMDRVDVVNSKDDAQLVVDLVKERLLGGLL